MKDAAEQAFAAWVSETIPPAPVVAEPVKQVKQSGHKVSPVAPNRVEQLWQATLQDILESDHPTAVPAIKHNLQAFGELVRMARGEQVDAIRLFFDEAREFEEDARKLQEHGKRAGRGKANPAKRRGAA